MDPLFVQNLRYNLQKRMSRLNSVGPDIFPVTLAQFWRFFDQHPTFVGITKELLATVSGVDEDVHRIFEGQEALLGKTEEDAAAIGFAEFCLTRFVEKMDVEATRINCVIAGSATAAMVPLDYPTDRKLLEVAFSHIGLTPPAEAKLLWIRNTLDVAEVECSKAYWKEAQERPDLQVLTDLRPLPLDASGHLSSIETKVPGTYFRAR